MNDRIFVGRQPILDVEGNIYAYEILFRNTEKNVAIVNDNLSATSAVLLNLLQNFGIEALLGSKKGFINIDESVIDAGIIGLLPADKTVLEILETTNVTDHVAQKINYYFQEEYTFALDDFIFSSEHVSNFNKLFSFIRFVKVDIRALTRAELTNNIEKLKSRNVLLLAEKVETREEFEFCKKLGFKYFQGYYFAKPLIVSTKKILDPSTRGIINVINILRDEKTSIDDIVNEMKKHPTLNINLLKFINSSMFFLKSDVTSIKHAAALIGRNNLSKWLMLLLYASKGNTDPTENPLMQTIYERSRMLESLARKVDKDLSEKAFLLGLLSLLDVLFEAPFEAFIDQFNVSTDIKESLQGSDNTLGKLLALVTFIEKYEIDNAEVILKELGLTLYDAADARHKSFILKDGKHIDPS